MSKLGRKTKYVPEKILPKIGEYLSMCGREQTSLPTISGLAVFLGVHRDTLYEWAKKYPSISDALKRVAEKQRAQLIDDGLYGGKEVNASMAIFLLKALHGLKENEPSVLQQFNIHNELKVPKKLLKKYVQEVKEDWWGQIAGPRNLPSSRQRRS